MYYGISTANLLISRGETLANEDTRNKAMGEAYFLRGYNYYRLFAQYGGVVIQTTPPEGVVRNFSRSSAEETLNQVIADLEEATNYCRQPNGVAMVHGLNILLLISWLKHCCIVSRNVVQTGTLHILQKPI